MAAMYKHAGRLAAHRRQDFEAGHLAVFPVEHDIGLHALGRIDRDTGTARCLSCNGTDVSPVRAFRAMTRADRSCIRPMTRFDALSCGGSWQAYVARALALKLVTDFHQREADRTRRRGRRPAAAAAPAAYAAPPRRRGPRGPAPRSAQRRRATPAPGPGSWPPLRRSQPRPSRSRAHAAVRWSRAPRRPRAAPATRPGRGGAHGRQFRGHGAGVRRVERAQN